jgi:hypothetical protein
VETIENRVQESRSNVDICTQDRTANVAPRASEISSTPNSSSILPEGSRRDRKRSRRNAAFAVREDTTEPLAEFYMAFTAGLTDSVKTSDYDHSDSPPQKLRLHRDVLPIEPTNWAEARRHSFAKYWFEAAHTEFAALTKRGTFKKRDREKYHRPLPLLWVFKYKFDTDGFLDKFKARICVRGDLQTSHSTDNYAATLAAKTFRAVMALAAEYDLDIKQLDAVNAFLNSDIDEEVTVYWPIGMEPSIDDNTPQQVLQLQKALYGLKQAPLLWHNHLVDLLQKLGLRRIPGVNCVLTSDWLIIFFYVDDIILLFDKDHRQKAEEFIVNLRKDLELREITDANWFLGIRIIRDRPNRLLWLCQDSYIDKLTAKFHIDDYGVLPHTPLAVDLLGAYDGQATPSERLGYQSRVGSINFAAVITRPDVAKACSILSQHLHNPGPEHLRAANRVLSYLTRTKFYAIQYGGIGEPKTLDTTMPFEVYSDAAFADNIDRKSSDGYLFMLYNGPIDWRASKQATVTTSSTEAELLALSRTAKELIAWRRLFTGIHFSTNDNELIYCDNRQTIRLLQQDEPLLTTKLRHVDIHQHWLREKVQNGDIAVAWTSTNDMKADGMTKMLPRQKHEAFIRQLNLIDIQDLIKR